MSVLSMILAAQLSLPIAAGLNTPDFRSIFRAEDVPRYFAAGKFTRMVSTRTTVAPDGSIQQCVADFSSGDAYLDSYTCGIILKRAKFQPARWVDGTPAYGVIRLNVVWVAMSFNPSMDAEMIAQPDMELFVDQLPKGERNRVTVNFMFPVDESGKLLGCSQSMPLAKHQKTFPDLVALGCSELTSHFTAVPPRSASGKPLRSVQNASVAFTIKRK